MSERKRSRSFVTLRDGLAIGAALLVVPTAALAGLRLPVHSSSVLAPIFEAPVAPVGQVRGEDGAIRFPARSADDPRGGSTVAQPVLAPAAPASDRVAAGRPAVEAAAAFVAPEGELMRPGAAGRGSGGAPRPASAGPRSHAGEEPGGGETDALPSTPPGARPATPGPPASEPPLAKPHTPAGGSTPGAGGGPDVPLAGDDATPTTTTTDAGAEGAGGESDPQGGDDADGTAPNGPTAGDGATPAPGGAPKGNGKGNHGNGQGNGGANGDPKGKQKPPKGSG